MQNFKPKDAVAILTLVLITVLKFQGLDGELDTAGALILGYYFARRGERDHQPPTQTQ